MQLHFPRLSEHAYCVLKMKQGKLSEIKSDEVLMTLVDEVQQNIIPEIRNLNTNRPWNKLNNADSQYYGN